MWNGGTDGRSRALDSGLGVFFYFVFFVGVTVREIIMARAPGCARQVVWGVVVLFRVVGAAGVQGWGYFFFIIIVLIKVSKGVSGRCGPGAVKPRSVRAKSTGCVWRRRCRGRRRKGRRSRRSSSRGLFLLCRRCGSPTGRPKMGIGEREGALSLSLVVGAPLPVGGKKSVMVAMTEFAVGSAHCRRWLLLSALAVAGKWPDRSSRFSMGQRKKEKKGQWRSCCRLKRR